MAWKRWWFQIKHIKEKLKIIFLDKLSGIIKENLVEIFLLIGIASISAGCFLWSPILGFVITGLLFIGLSFLIYKGGD